MTATTAGWALVCIGLVGLAVTGAVHLVKAFDRRADKVIRGHVDAALLHGDEWREDQAIGITKDGSHDRIGLSMCERITFEEIERVFQEQAKEQNP